MRALIVSAFLTYLGTVHCVAQQSDTYLNPPGYRTPQQFVKESLTKQGDEIKKRAIAYLTNHVPAVNFTESADTYRWYAANRRRVGLRYTGHDDIAVDWSVAEFKIISGKRAALTSKIRVDRVGSRLSIVSDDGLKRTWNCSETEEDNGKAHVITTDNFSKVQREKEIKRIKESLRANLKSSVPMAGNLELEVSREVETTFEKEVTLTESREVKTEQDFSTKVGALTVTRRGIVRTPVVNTYRFSGTVTVDADLFADLVGTYAGGVPIGKWSTYVSESVRTIPFETTAEVPQMTEDNLAMQVVKFPSVEACNKAFESRQDPFAAE